MARVNGATVDVGQGYSWTQQTGTTSGVTTETGLISGDNETWLDISQVCNPSTRATAAARWSGYLGASSSNNYPDVKTLVAFVGYSDYDSVSYPIESGIITDMPHELLTFNFEPSPQWSWNGVFYYPKSCKGVVDATNGSGRVFCTLYQDANNHIEISVRTTTTVRFAVTIAGVLTNYDVSVGTASSPAGIYWGDIVEVFVKTNGSNMDLYAKIGYDQTFGTTVTTGKITPEFTKISNKDGTQVQDIRVLANYFWPKETDVSILTKPLSARVSSDYLSGGIVSDIWIPIIKPIGELY
jgi:hypothetical protein